MIALGQLANLPLGHGDSNIQESDIERLRQIIVGARLQCLLEIGGIGARRNEENKHLVTVWLGAQFPAQLDSAFSRQHPIENQKRKVFGRERGLRFFGAAERNDFVSPPRDEPLEIPPATRMVFDEQDFHFRRSYNRSAPQGLTSRGHVAPRSAEYVVRPLSGAG